MKNMDTKVIGYILILVGLVTIVVATFNVYQVFTKQAQPINVFDLEGIKMSLAGVMELPAGVEAPELDLIPSSTLNQTTNLMAHLFLMGFIVNVGAKIASIGSSLVRPINVSIKNNGKA